MNSLLIAYSNNLNLNLNVNLNLNLNLNLNPQAEQLGATLRDTEITPIDSTCDNAEAKPVG